MKTSPLAILLLILLISIFPIYCSSVVMHEFGHYLAAKALGQNVVGGKLTCSMNENSRIMVYSEGRSSFIALGSLLSLLNVIPFLILLFFIKDKRLYSAIFAFYAYLSVSAFLLMEGDFRSIGLLWLNWVLLGIVIGIGLIPFIARKSKPFCQKALKKPE